MAISDFADMMGETISHLAQSTVDDYGKPTYLAGVNFSARTFRKAVKVRDSRGEEIDADGVVWILGTPNIRVDDLIQLPDTTTPVIVAVDRPSDELSTHHVKVYFRG